MTESRAARTERGPGARPSRRHVWPFAVALLVGSLTMLLPPYDGNLTGWHLLAAAVLLGVVAGAQVVAFGRSERSGWDLVAPLTVFPLVVVLRDAGGGAVSGAGALVAVPILWLSLFGSMRVVLVAAGMVLLTFAAPALLLAGADYPPSEWRRALVWTLVAGLLTPVVLGVVRRLAVETDRSARAVERLDGVLSGATLTGLVTTDRAGVVTSFGVGAERLLRREADAAVGRPFLDLGLHRGELATVAETLDVAPGFAVLTRLAARHDPGMDWTMTRGDGGSIHVRMAVTPLRDADGRLTGYLCAFIDATTTVRAGLTLRAAEERWRVLMANLPDTTVVMLGDRGNVTLVTGGGSLARSLRDGAGRRLHEVVDQLGPGTLRTMLATAYTGREAGPVTVPVDGVDHEVVVSPLPSEGGHAQAVLVARDVGEDRERGRRIGAALARAQRFFDAAPQGVALVRPDGVLVQANPTLRALLGGDPAGTPLAGWSLDPVDTTVGDHLAEVVAAGGDRVEQAWALRPGRASGAAPALEPVHVLLISTLLEGEALLPGERVPGGPPDGETAAPSDLVLTHVVDVSDRLRYEQRLAFLAGHDPLTGLANRRRLDQMLTAHVEDCLRYGPRGALLMLDLDHFKEVNDSLGHAVGDHLLVAISRRLEDRMRTSDLVARLGGDEFAVLLPHADRPAAAKVAGDLVELVRDLFTGHHDVRREVTASIGIAVVGPGHHDASDVLVAADQAMYRAKQAGRDRTAFLSGEPE